VTLWRALLKARFPLEGNPSNDKKSRYIKPGANSDRKSLSTFASIRSKRGVKKLFAKARSSFSGSLTLRSPERSVT
jgi:hypothetical protein